MTAVRSQHTATLLDNGKVLIAAGFGAASLASAEEYDPNAGTSPTARNLSQDRNTHTATRLPSGNVLIVGGFGLVSTLASADLYMPDKRRARASWQ